MAIVLKCAHFIADKIFIPTQTLCAKWWQPFLTNPGEIMKQKHIFILFALLLPYTVTISPATAVSTCIPLTPDDNCSFSYVSYGGPDWEGNCAGTTATSIKTSNNPAENKYCWCKLISPAVSLWHFVYIEPDADAEDHYLCSEICSTHCGAAFNYSYIPTFISD